MSFEIIKVGGDDSYYDQFGDLKEIVKEINEHPNLEKEKFKEEQEQNLSRLNSVLGEDMSFEELNNLFEDKVEEILEDEEETDLAFEKVHRDELTAVTEEEMKKRWDDLTDISGDFNINDFKEGDKAMTPEEKRLSEERTQRANEKDNYVEGHGDHSREVPFDGNNNTRANVGTNRQTAGQQFFGGGNAQQRKSSGPETFISKNAQKTKRKQENTNNFGNNKTNNQPTSKEDLEAKEKERIRLELFDEFFTGLHKYGQNLGMQFSKGWVGDREREQQEVRNLNRGEKNPLKRLANRMRVLLNTKRAKVTLKVTALFSLNIAMGIMTRQVEFESIGQILAVLGISVTTFYISRELTEEGYNIAV